MSLLRYTVCFVLVGVGCPAFFGPWTSKGLGAYFILTAFLICADDICTAIRERAK